MVEPVGNISSFINRVAYMMKNDFNSAEVRLISALTDDLKLSDKMIADVQAINKETAKLVLQTGNGTLNIAGPFPEWLTENMKLLLTVSNGRALIRPYITNEEANFVNNVTSNKNVNNIDMNNIQQYPVLQSLMLQGLIKDSDPTEVSDEEIDVNEIQKIKSADSVYKKNNRRNNNTVLQSKLPEALHNLAPNIITDPFEIMVFIAISAINEGGPQLWLDGGKNGIRQAWKKLDKQSPNYLYPENKDIYGTNFIWKIYYIPYFDKNNRLQIVAIALSKMNNKIIIETEINNELVQIETSTTDNYIYNLYTKLNLINSNIDLDINRIKIINESPDISLLYPVKNKTI